LTEVVTEVTTSSSGLRPDEGGRRQELEQDKPGGKTGGDKLAGTTAEDKLVSTTSVDSVLATPNEVVIPTPTASVVNSGIVIDSRPHDRPSSATAAAGRAKTTANACGYREIVKREMSADEQAAYDAKQAEIMAHPQQAELYRRIKARLEKYRT
jgi:hypothetical protein